MLEEATPRQVLAERLHDLLVVAVARSGDRIPDDHRVGRSRVRPASGPAASSTVPTRIGAPIACGGHRDLLRRVGVGQRVDIRRVLRPDHELRLRRAARHARLGQPEGLPNVVVQHRAALRVEVQAEPGHVALHHRDGDGRFVARSGPGVPHLRPDDGGQRTTPGRCR